LTQLVKEIVKTISLILGKREYKKLN
jgi:hypothetical protein